jgi:N utilization substance protein B
MARPAAPARSHARSAARLGAAMALYQREMAGAAVGALVEEFRAHRLGAQLDDGLELRAADEAFFEDVVRGAVAREAEIDALIAAALSEGWTLARLDRPLRAVLRAASYELLARPDVPAGAVIDDYVEVAKALGDQALAGFANGVLDRVAREVRAPAGD